ncbi:hypothetical protein KO527_20425 [Pseudoalteromonas sp. C2R02]|uniref:hypothetical protein n=1 Tax=Pseudoalteromonas sp. C2R02 TaxID=2841565 RepID=UPI001C09CE93|nr:hypothetical protein [Pseudoalteromonas sp. C2R02]MBU2971720.1 hypothetical protein [Pseudoalteromonas sp. C2R02]
MIKRLNTLALASSLILLSACSSTSDELKEINSPQIFRISDGIEVALIAPIGFNITQEHYGFAQAESFSRIKISEVESPLANYLPSLTKENLLKNKLQLTNSEQINVSGALCTLMTLRQNIAGTYFEKLWLIAGDNLSSIQVEASYPEGANSQLKQAIKNSLLSLSVATEQTNRLYTGLPFMFTNTPEYKVKQRYANSIVLLPLEKTDSQESIVVSHGVTKQPIENIKQLSDHFLKKGKHYKNVEILKNEMIKINEISALLTTAYVDLNEKPSFVYQVTSYQKEKFLLLQGQTPKENKTQFKNKIDELLKHFKFK